MQTLDDLLAKCGFTKREVADRIDFNIIESLAGFQLPMDYKYYLANYHSFEGFIGQEYIALYEADRLLALNEINDEDISYTKLIGSNGASESMGIRMNEDGTYHLVIAQYLSEIDDHIVIGVSFTDMIERLVNGTGWFE
jgi:hypothetical protein